MYYKYSLSEREVTLVKETSIAENDGRCSVVQRTVTLEGDMIKSGGGVCFTEFECFVIPTRKGISTSYISRQTT